ncbi:MAG: zf-TFIIB domain-containing protein [Actinoallomurus sp.]
MADTGMYCPKCSGNWETHERSGVVVDECVGCQGVFLDRGELERLIDAESEYLAKIDPPSDDDTSYHGRHRRGIIHQVFTAAE